MLEIVHDLAPGAQLYFANAGDGTSLSFEQAVNFLAANTDVVVDDISFLGSVPYDGTSAVSTNTATARIRTQIQFEATSRQLQTKPSTIGESRESLIRERILRCRVRQVRAARQP